MKRLFFLAVIVVSLFIIKDLAYSIWTLLQKQDLLVSTQQELAKQKRENAALKQDLARVKTPNFIETEARNKLLLVKPGERLVVVPSGTPEDRQEKEQQEVPNWQQWITLFFSDTGQN